MSFNSSRVDVHGHAFNNVEGNQVNQTISAQVVNFNSQGETERTEYDEFRTVTRGDTVALERLHTEDLSERWRWEWESKDGELFRKSPRSTLRTICTVRVDPDQQRKYTAVIYEGKDAEISWKEDFEYYSRAGLGKPEIWQLYGLNRSKIPFLIFHGELVPLANVYKESFWRSLFVNWLKYQLECEPWEIWMNTQGNLCKGLDGPHLYTPPTPVLSSIIVPSSAQFLQGDISFQYFCQFPSPRFDKVILEHVYWQFEFPLVDELFRKLADHHPPSDHTHSYSTKEYPYLKGLFREWPNHFPLDIISGLRFDTIYSFSRGAVASWPRGSCSLWETSSSSYGFEVMTEMGDGLIRFELHESGDVNIQLSFEYTDFWESWLAQSSRIIDAHNRSGTEEEEEYFIVHPSSLKLGTSPHSEHQKPTLSLTFEKPRPIYLFIHPPPMSVLELISWLEGYTQTHFWSFDENGQSQMTVGECRRWGVPVLVPSIGTYHTDLELRSWRTTVYPALRQWQVARGFDPTTTDWAQSLGYPEWEIISRKNDEARFKELHKNTPWASDVDLHEHPAAEQLDTSSPIQTQDLQQEVTNSFWGTLMRKGNQLLNSLTPPKIPGQPRTSRGQCIGGDDAHGSEGGQFGGVGSKRKADQEDGSNHLTKRMRLN